MGDRTFGHTKVLYPGGDPLFKQGEALRYIYVVRAGMIRLEVADLTGKILGTKDFGELAIIGGWERRPASATARVPATFTKPCQVQMYTLGEFLSSLPRPVDQPRHLAETLSATVTPLARLIERLASAPRSSEPSGLEKALEARLQLVEKTHALLIALLESVIVPTLEDHSMRHPELHSIYKILAGLSAGNERAFAELSKHWRVVPVVKDEEQAHQPARTISGIRLKSDGIHDEDTDQDDRPTPLDIPRAANKG